MAVVLGAIFIRHLRRLLDPEERALVSYPVTGSSSPFPFRVASGCLQVRNTFWKFLRRKRLGKWAGEWPSE